MPSSLPAAPSYQPHVLVTFQFNMLTVLIPELPEKDRGLDTYLSPSLCRSYRG